MHQMPVGVPIPEEIHNQYSDELKFAWETFHSWWLEARDAADYGPVARSSMPDEVRQAMELILETPIPTYDGLTGADSCYMIGVQSMMTE